MKSWKIPRRTFLKGMGTTILLPMLDVMMPASSAQSTSSPPRFVAYLISLAVFGQGFDPTQNSSARYFPLNPSAPGAGGTWLPKQAGPFSAPFGPSLAPIQSFQNKVTIISGMGTLVGDGTYSSINHSTATTCWLTSAYPSSAASTKICYQNGSFTPANNTPPSSIDQYIANSLGYTPGSTLVLSPSSADFVEEMGGHRGYISYNSALAGGGSTLVPKVTDPMIAFKTLFGNCQNQGQMANASGKSVLDFVMDQIAGVEKNVGTADKARLDSYFQNIRDLEIKLMTANTCPATPTATPPYSGTDLDWVTKMNMFVDVISLAIASDTMPIATLMSDLEGNGEPYASQVAYLSNYIGINGQKIVFSSPNLGIHVDVTHQENNGYATKLVEEHIAYSQANFTFLQRLLHNLDSMPVEPNGNTPLDNTLILTGACHSDAGTHNTANLPTILAGGKRYGLNQSRTINFPPLTDIGNLHYTISKALGVSGNSFNGFHTILPGIFG